MLLIFIYYYKSLLSFADIENILKPIIQDYFFAKNNPDISLNEIYRQIMELNIDNLTDIKKDLIAKFDKAQNTFKGATCKSHEQLVLFSFTSELLFDIYLKKRIVERISEYLSDDEEHTKK